VLEIFAIYFAINMAILLALYSRGHLVSFVYNSEDDGMFLLVASFLIVFLFGVIFFLLRPVFFWGKPYGG